MKRKVVLLGMAANAAALEQLATLLGWRGRFDDAIAAWRRALAEKPDHPDYVLGPARVEYWKGVRLDCTHETYGEVHVRNSVGSALTFKS